jgi:hypothetical protein
MSSKRPEMLGRMRAEGRQLGALGQRDSRRLALRSRSAIIVAINQYAEAAVGNREFFLNKPNGIGGSRKDNIVGLLGAAYGLCQTQFDDR